MAELLALPGSVYPVFGLCLGYPDQAPEVKPRLPLATVLKEDAYRDPDGLDGIQEVRPRTARLLPDPHQRRARTAAGARR